MTTAQMARAPQATQTEEVAGDKALDQSHAFDFLYGKWTMHNRRLVQRLADSHEWVEFPSTVDCRPLPNGMGNEDVYRTEYWPNFVGLTFRFYNPDNKQWSLYWIDNRNMPGVLQVPVVGSFTDGVGIFEGPDEFNGQPILVRYTWVVLDAEHARWEQAFSPDAGKNWETNWSMDFTRVRSEERRVGKECRL